MVKKKTNPSKKGRKLEDLTVMLLRNLSKEFGFTNEKLRRQESGSQFGKDVIWNFRIKSGEKIERYHWVIEGKNYDTKLTPQLLGHKLDQANRSSVNIPIDNFVLLSPRQSVNNDYSEAVDSEKLPYTFGLVFWTPDEEIDKLFQCFPTIYEKVYKKTNKISDEERKKILGYWRDKILEDAKRGLEIRLSKSSVKQSSTTDSVVEIDSDSAKQLLQKTTKAVIQTPPSRNTTNTSPKETADPTEKGLVTIEIDEALEILNVGKIEQALTRFFTILGKVQGKANLQHELARTYNNIGVSYNRLGKNEEATQYFQKALEAEKGFIVPATNLASTFISQAEHEQNDKKKKELLGKAEKIIEPLISDFYQGNEVIVLHAYMKLLKVRDGVDAVTKFIRDEANKKYSKVFHSSSSLMFYSGSIYLELGNPDEAEKFADKSIQIEDDVDTRMLRGRVRMLKALTHDAIYQHQDFDDITPTFDRTEQIEAALEDFHEARNQAEKIGDEQLISDIKQFEQIAVLWLRDSERIGDFELDLENKYVSAVKAFRERRFEVSYDLLKKTMDWSQLPPSEIWRLARVYLYNGAPEIARDLLNSVESVADEDKNFQYWMDRSMVEVLLQNKNQAIFAATKAKELASGEKQKRIALSHRGAVLLRFADEDGGDRVLDNSFEYEKEFPESQILTRFDFEKDKEKVLKMVKDRHDWVKDIQEKFTSKPIPSYYLEEVFHEPYIGVWRGRDPQFSIEYTITSDEFRNELEQNYKKGKGFVFDYISLLTISKLNQLYSIEKYFPAAKISFSLFLKIQEELLRREDPILRKLWDFLRKNQSVEIVKNIPNNKLVNGRINDLFGEWMEDTLKLAKEPDTVLITDDFVVYRFSKSENVTPLNTWYLLQMAFEEGQIDKPMYSKALGGLAECFYTFIGFDGEDLFQIIADDHYKLTARSYHLINQAFLPNANPQSFTQTFIPFIRRLWATGATSPDKVYWLSYVTNICTDITDEIVRRKMDVDVFKQVALDSALIWNMAITSGGKEDLELLKKDLDTILKGQALESIKSTIIKKIGEEFTKFK